MQCTEVNRKHTTRADCVWMSLASDRQPQAVRDRKCHDRGKPRDETTLRDPLVGSLGRHCSLPLSKGCTGLSQPPDPRRLVDGILSLPTKVYYVNRRSKIACRITNWRSFVQAAR